MKKILFCLLICLSACSMNHGNFTILSNKKIDFSNLNIENSQKIEKVKGVDEGQIIMSGFEIGNMNPNINGALSDALTKTQGDLMTNVKVKQSFVFIPFFYSIFDWSVEGEVIKLK